jgi:hypothetical protein
MTTSTDGTTWTSRTSGFSTNNINGVTYGNGVYVAGGTGGTLTTSTDGTTWTARTSGFGAETIREVGYGNSQHIAIGASGLMTVSNNVVEALLVPITYQAI